MIILLFFGLFCSWFGIGCPDDSSNTIFADANGNFIVDTLVDQMRIANTEVVCDINVFVENEKCLVKADAITFTDDGYYFNKNIKSAHMWFDENNNIQKLRGSSSGYKFDGKFKSEPISFKNENYYLIQNLEKDQKDFFFDEITELKKPNCRSDTKTTVLPVENGTLTLNTNNPDQFQSFTHGAGINPFGLTDSEFERWEKIGSPKEPTNSDLQNIFCEKQSIESVSDEAKHE